MEKFLNFNKFSCLGILGGLILGQFIYPDIVAASGLPWDSKFEQVYESITGTVATCVTGVIIVAVGFAIGASEGGGSAKRGLQLIMGLCMSLLAVQFIAWIRG